MGFDLTTWWDQNVAFGLTPPIFGLNPQPLGSIPNVPLPDGVPGLRLGRQRAGAGEGRGVAGRGT